MFSWAAEKHFLLLSTTDQYAGKIVTVQVNINFINNTAILYYAQHCSFKHLTTIATILHVQCKKKKEFGEANQVGRSLFSSVST